MIPWLSLPSSTSVSERIIPSDSTPRSFARPRRVPSGSTAPGSATSTVSPGATFRAPHTIVRMSEPASCTLQTRRRSASGCCSALITLPIRKKPALPSPDGTPTRTIRSSSVPLSERRSPISSAESPGSQYAFSHVTGTFTSGPSLELLQEADVVLEEDPQVGDPVLEHRDPLDPHAERKALDTLRVVAVVAHELEHVRVDHARAHDLDPARALAERAERAVRPATGSVTHKTRHVHLDARLGEREVPRAQSHALPRAEHRARELQQRSLEIGQRDVLVDGEALDLGEHRRVGRIRVAPVDDPRYDD